MDDPALVRRRQRARQLDGVVDRAPQRQSRDVHPPAERFPLEVLHDDEGAPLVLPHVVDGDDVRVGEGGKDLRLAPEPRERDGVGRERRHEQLDGHVAVEPRVTGPVDLAHGTGPERSGNLVGADERSGSERHGDGKNYTGRRPPHSPRSCGSERSGRRSAARQAPVTSWPPRDRPGGAVRPRSLSP